MTNIDKILKIKTNNIKPVKGKILISEPFLIDFYFQRSVVLLAEHNDEGTFGLVLNKPVDIKLDEIISDFPPFETTICLGGPVKTDNLYFVHTVGNNIDDSLEIGKNLYWGGDIENVKELILLNQIKSHEIKFFVGYSGWVSNQLDDELQRNSWLVSNTNAAEVMKIGGDEIWKSAVKKMGDEYAYWINFPTDPTHN